MGGIERLRKVIKSFNGVKARAGWFSSAKYNGNGVPVARVAMWQEYGTSKIPPRPFMRPTILSKSGEWLDTAGRGVNAVFMGKGSAATVMTALAQRVAADLRVAISEVREPPISPVTHLLREWRRSGAEINQTKVWEAINAVKKGERASGVSDQPLNDTGYMITTLTGIAVKK